MNRRYKMGTRCWFFSMLESYPNSIVLNYTVDGVLAQATFAEFDSVTTQSLQRAIVHGVGVGCGIMLLFLSWVVIINKKTPIFVMNQVTLVLMVIKLSLYLAYLLGPLNSLAYIFTGIANNDWNAYRVTVATNVFHILLIASVETTLVFQIYVVFKSPEVRRAGYALTGLAAAFGVVTVGFYFNSTIRNDIQLKNQLLSSSYSTYGSWVNSVPIILFSASLNFTCIVLIYKLVKAVRTRRYLGLKQFDSFHILIISTTQTCIIPSILVIVNYKQTDSSTLLANISVILAVCNLPLSSLWATSANNSPQPSSSQNSVLSRYDLNTSSQMTLAKLYAMNPEKVGRIDFDLEKVTLEYNDRDDQESIERILNNIEDGFAAVTTHALK